MKEILVELKRILKCFLRKVNRLLRILRLVGGDNE